MPFVANIRQNRTLIESFISGIRNDELAIKLLEENFQNLGQAIERAVHYYQALQTRRFIKTESDFRPSLEKVYNVSKNIDSEENKPAKEQDVNAVNASPTEQPQSHYNQKSHPNINMPAPAPANLQFSGHAHYNRMFLQNPNQATWGNQQYFNEPMKHPFAGPDWPSQPANNQNWQQYPPWLNNQRFLNMPRPQNMTRRSKPNRLIPLWQDWTLQERMLFTPAYSTEPKHQERRKELYVLWKIRTPLTQLLAFERQKHSTKQPNEQFKPIQTNLNTPRNKLVSNGVKTPRSKKMDCGNKSYVCVYLFDTAYYALCDSGSPVTIVNNNYDIVPNELYDLIETTNTSLVGANGSNLDVVGRR